MGKTAAKWVGLGLIANVIVVYFLIALLGHSDYITKPYCIEVWDIPLGLTVLFGNLGVSLIVAAVRTRAPWSYSAKFCGSILLAGAVICYAYAILSVGIGGDCGNM